MLPYVLEQPVLDPFIPGKREQQFGRVTIYEYEQGLLYIRGKLTQQIGPGVYRIWPFQRRRIVVLDTRTQSLTVVGQRFLTADQLPVTLDLLAEYRIVDAVAALHKVVNYQNQLHTDLQLALRTVVGNATMDALLREQAALNLQILDLVRSVGAAYGMEVARVAIRDVVLTPKVRDLLMKEAETKCLAQAALLAAREEVATLRALSNAARMAADNPYLLRLRELDALRSAAQTPGATLVFGVGNVVPVDTAKAKAKPPTAEHGQEE